MMMLHFNFAVERSVHALHAFDDTYTPIGGHDCIG